MRTTFLLVVFLFTNRLSAQQMDSVIIRQDKVLRAQDIYFPGLPRTETKLKVRSLVIPAAFISYGFIALSNKGLQKLNGSTKFEIIEDHPAFFTKVDNYLQYAPAAAVYGLNALGIKGKNNFRDRTIIYTLSTLISAAFVLPLKKITSVQRPDGSGFTSFPSGHTTTVFAAAEFLRLEYRDVSPWYGIGGYVVSTATGILRLYNNKHWINDVVAGAGFGILSTKLAYWVYPIIKRKFFENNPVNTMLIPYYENKGGGLAVVYQFNH